MSEHITITGDIQHWHSPQEIFCYCKRCKRENTKAIMDIDQGFSGFSIKMRCQRCKKTIWVAKIDTWVEKDSNFKYINKDNKKCEVCGKPTNQYDCVAIGGVGGKRKFSYWCSNKCYRKGEKEERKLERAKWERRKK